MQYDLIIIGGGPGGYTAAFEAAANKLKTALIEEREIGGTCLNRGCIPTKTLVHTADLYREVKNASGDGIVIAGSELDIPALNAKKETVVGTLRSGLEKQLKAAGVEVISARASVIDGHTVRVNDAELTADNVIIASGSVPAVLPIEGCSLEGVISSDDILRDVPVFESLIIIGGGVIGCEIAGIYESFGTKVTVLEAMDNLLPTLDSEAGRSLAMLFKKRGIDVHCKAFAKGIEKTEEGLCLTYEEKGVTKTVTAERILIAAGRRASTDLFEGAAPAMEKGRIITDECGRTDIEGLYAIGDAAAGYPQLAHTAMAMAVNAAARIAGTDSHRNLDVIPSGVYTSPEIGSVGLSEKEAQARGSACISGKANTMANARSLISGGERGFVKITAEKETGKIIGAVMMCERATDLIQEPAAMIAEGMTVNEALQIIHGHPTFAEVIVSALEALQAKLQKA